ncbi:hypothetical protein cypCar_00042412, partial [Cyprinus carpio]
EQDSGTYRCAVDKSGIDFYTEVNLNVVAGQQIRTMTGYSEGNIIMNFKYEMQQKNLLIDVCNTEALQCFTLINTDRAAEWTHDGRFSVHDDRSKGFLHVFIRDLNVKDSGEYKIIVTVSEDYSFFSEFYLDIKKGSSLIVPLVLVLLVLIIVGLLFLFLCKKHQSRDREKRNKLWPLVDKARRDNKREYFVGGRAFLDGTEIFPPT